MRKNYDNFQQKNLFIFDTKMTIPPVKWGMFRLVKMSVFVWPPNTFL